jgi:transcriptional regulator with XRE-family HTH domain
MWNDTGMSNAPDTTTAELAQLVGARVRTLREQRGWSLSALAAQAGVGKATLSEIEAGRRNATLETLYAIAAQLEVGLSVLLTAPSADPVVSADLGLSDGPGVSANPVVHGDAVDGVLVAAYHDPGVTTEIYRLRIRPGRVQVSPGHGVGVVENLLVTAGRVQVGPVDAPVEVAAGDDLIWEAAGPHSYVALGPEPAEAVLVIRHPVV